MRICDIHTHVFPDEVAPRAVAKLVEDGGLTPYYDGTAAGLLADMDRTGVSVSVLCPVATRASQVTSINDWTASLANERLVAFGGIHPDFPDPAAEIERMVALGIKGIKLHPEFQGFHPEDERMDAIYVAAAERGLPILYHAGEDPNYTEWNGRPDVFARITAAHPDLTLILAHMGGFRMWEQVTEHLLGARVYLDTAYTFGHLPPADFGEIVRGHGADRILFGSDGPWMDAAQGVEALHELGLSEDELHLILWNNAAGLLGLGD